MENDSKKSNGICWEKIDEERFNQLIAKIPVFLRSVAMEKVSQRVEKILMQENRQVASERDLVEAFFLETPFGFHGPLKMDMQLLGIDYTKYGYEK